MDDYRRATLFGVPHALPDPRAAVLGLPFDVGTRTGPAHIRAHSQLVAEHARDWEPPPFAGLIDLDLVPGDVDASYPRIERAIGEIGFPITLGGDGAVTLPLIRAMSKRHEDLVVVHVDAHTDAYGPARRSPTPTRSSTRRARSSST